MGGGLAGCEAAFALAERGVAVTLHEMRPVKMTPAHQTESLAELVCSNTFKSVEPLHAHGLLKAEMRLLGSIVLQAADAARIPGGSALTGGTQTLRFFATDASGNWSAVQSETYTIEAPSVSVTVSPGA